MRIDLAAFNADGTPTVDRRSPVKDQTVIHAYPKDEPVLESSFVFPKVESYGLWHYSTSLPLAVSANR